MATLVDEAAGASSALAVTKADGSGNRSLYWVGGLKGIVKYTISASGVSAGTTLVAYTGGIGAPGYEGAEAEVDQGEKNVLWVDRSGEVFSADISVQGGTVRKYIYPKRLGSWGVEFDDSEAGFYVSTTTSTGTVSGGIHHFSDVANTTTSTLVSSTANYQKTFIEKAKDGSFYAVNKDGILGKFTGNGPATNAFGSLQVFSSGNLFSGSGSHYKLPDQIDGDNYDYFFGVNPYNLTGMAINGTPLVDMVPPPPPTFYNCLPISLATLICLVIIWARPLPCVSRA